MAKEELILLKLSKIESMMLNAKKILSVDELSDYTGYSKSTIYKMVQKNILPHSKPNGKHIFFDKTKIDEWLLSNSSTSDFEITKKANDYIKKNLKKL
ncbi:DNA-binding protein [Ornithobacterium rhinotracheale]|uniref:DNA-binding protein n=1 Tax=Ornithobacterium rhinotracheale TaxID=28251 RepID=A0A3R5Y2T8_ORNRH|nr:helix-turn-helix domain-containing protein [Ornithobacterium rhinotracheale]MRJ11322.1 DNA-binding protein [Ornithobacterium rhinotracheale]QAR30426.1 DNA-binding protein [Ornithobacterium rhinotracheale]